MQCPMDDALTAAGGLSLHVSEAGLRVAWEHPDWLGPLGFCAGGREELVAETTQAFEGADGEGRYRGLRFTWPGAPTVATTVRAYVERPLIVFGLEATAACEGLAGARFDEPSVVWPHLHPTCRRPGGLPDGAVAFGHQYTEFALPTFSDASLAEFFLLPMRPAVVFPLVLSVGGRSLLLGPLNHFHEQIVAVPRSVRQRERGVRCGWHGDLDRVPEGFCTELALWGAPGVRAALSAWGEGLRREYAAPRRSRYGDDATGKLSYWTDNGAAYWYRTEGGRTVEETLGDTLDGLRAMQVPVHAVELDSWFYSHEVSRAFDAAEVEVPPTGAIRWEPREDVLPQGLGPLHERMGRRPLILHGRHFSTRSPYFEAFEAWHDGDRAHPKHADLFELLLEQAATWGAVAYEQDWMVESFLGVRGLREAPGRARQWQRALDRAAARRSLSLIWCMSTPADFCQSLELARVSAIRTSGDYRYIVGSASLWCWFLYGNALARSLGLLPFKDVFLSSRDGEDRDGDPHAEIEAMLSALSAGPVGIGDRLGRTDRDLVLRTCRADGVLVKPDVPLAAIDASYRGHAYFEGPLVAETHSDHPAGRWVYVAALHANRGDATERFDVPLQDVGVTSPVVAWSWRSRTARRLEPREALSYALEPRDWSLEVLCPVLADGIAIIGDPAVYATAGDRRLRGVRCDEEGTRFEVLGAPGERVTIVGWSAGRAPAARRRTPGEVSSLDVTGGPDGAGTFLLSVHLGACGWVGVQLEV
jgi:hypothetical protein